MGILVDKNTRVLVQGFTGREGTFHAEQMIAYGTKVVGGVTPGKGGTSHLNLPVFDSVSEAARETGADASVIFVPAAFGADAIFEAATAGIKLIICITEGIPVQDMLRANFYAKSFGARVIGPNGPGITTVDACKIGIMPGKLFKKGPVGVVSRSGTLTYEIVADLTRNGIGQTTCVGIGGDPLPGTRFMDVLPLFESDSETRAVVLVGEIGGTDEEDAAQYVATMKKPVVAFISGRSAPPGKRMGHAGAIISGSSGTADSKIKALGAARVPVANLTSEIPGLVQAALAKKGVRV